MADVACFTRPMLLVEDTPVDVEAAYERGFPVATAR